MTAALSYLAVVVLAGVAGFALGALWMLRRQVLGYRSAKRMWPYLVDRGVWRAIGRSYVSRRWRALRAGPTLRR